MIQYSSLINIKGAVCDFLQPSDEHDVALHSNCQACTLCSILYHLQVSFKM